LKEQQAIMAIKEPVFNWRKYMVTQTVEYIPCLPVRQPEYSHSNELTSTRVPKGAEVTFIKKYDNELVEIVYRIDSSKEIYRVLVVSDFICEYLLPLYKR
jgi:hypothetical protein